MTAARAGVCVLAAAGALAGAAVLAGCGSSGSSSGSGSAANAHGTPTVNLARAAYVTTRAPGLRFSLLIISRVGGVTETISGSGALDTRDRSGSVDVTAGGVHVHEVLAYPYEYVRSSAAQQVAVGKPWLRIDAATLEGTEGLSSSASYDPSQELTYLRAAGSVRRVGAQLVRGVSTTHYHAVVSLHRVTLGATAAQRVLARRSETLFERITGGDTLPMDVYVDGQGRARRVILYESICTPTGRLAQTIGVDYYDFAAQPAPPLPPPSQSKDVTAKLIKAFEAGVSDLRCVSTKKSAAPG